MNKRRIIIIIGIILSATLIAILVLTKYSVKNINNKEAFNEKTQKSAENGENINKNKYIRISSYVEKEKTLYQYRVYSKQGKLLYEEKNMSKYPNIKKIEDYKFSVGISAGTSIYLVRYFDVLNEQVSDVFETPLDIMDSKIIIYNGKKGEIIVQDIFDKSKYYEEIELKSSDAVFPIVFARFLSTDTIQVRYMAGDDYEEKTETFRLKK